MGNRFQTWYFWSAGHESVSLHREVVEGYESTDVVMKSNVFIGTITQKCTADSWIVRMPKAYWTSCLADPHFSEWREINDHELHVKGALCDLMFEIQGAAGKRDAIEELRRDIEQSIPTESKVDVVG